MKREYKSTIISGKYFIATFLNLELDSTNLLLFIFLHCVEKYDVIVDAMYGKAKTKIEKKRNKKLDKKKISDRSTLKSNYKMPL